MPDRDGRRVLHGRRHCKPAGDLPSGKAVRCARDGGRRARTGGHRRRRTRHGKLLWSGRPGGRVYGHVLQISGKPRWVHGGVEPRGRLCAAQLAPIYLLGVHSACKLRRGACCAAGAGSASGVGHKIAAERAVFKKTALGRAYADARIKRRNCADHSDLHL